MKYFKKIETKIQKAGWNLVYQSETCIKYVKYNEQFNYAHRVELIRKTGRTPIIQSYQENCHNESNFDNMVGLDVKSIKLFLKFIKKLKWV